MAYVNISTHSSHRVLLSDVNKIKNSATQLTLSRKTTMRRRLLNLVHMSMTQGNKANASTVRPGGVRFTTIEHKRKWEGAVMASLAHTQGGGFEAELH
jgi:hypothetical protein